MTELSIIIPIYNEAGAVQHLKQQLCTVLESVTQDWEVLCINDGSQDNSQAQLEAWRAEDARVKIITLSRNFGKEAALSAGLDHASGAAVIPFDVDLQDPPEVIPQMVALWKKGHKVVLAVRKTRDGDNWLKRSTAWLFYRALSSVTSVPIPANAGDFRLMDAQVVAILKLLPERTRFMKGLFAWVGFDTVTVHYDRKPRSTGAPKQSWMKLWSLAKDGVFSFTTLPLKFTMYIGVMFSTLAFAYGAWLLLRTLILGVDVPGYASIMASILFMGGIQLMCLGIIGEYIGRIYRETKHRPIYVIARKQGIDSADEKKIVNLEN